MLVSKADEDERNEDALQWIIGTYVYGDAFCAKDKDKARKCQRRRKNVCLLLACQWVQNRDGCWMNCPQVDYATDNQEKEPSVYD